MADVKINLEATHKEFLAAITAASKASQDLLSALNKMSAAHTQAGAAASKHAATTTQSTQTLNQNAQAAHRTASAYSTLWTSVLRTVGGMLLLVEAGKKVYNTFSGAFNAIISNIDDFKKQTIGTAAAITNIRDETQTAGQTWNEVFNKNLKATVGTFLELERLSARYFASSIDLQLAYNAFAQRGIIIRKSELEQLAQLTDLILLLTQGQQTTIQVQEEIRSLINGTLRPTAQLGQLLKSYGKDIKDVGAEIRATQSIRPLEGVLRGAAEATGQIQGTFQAVMNGLEVAFRQIGRIGGEQFFNQIVHVVERFATFITANREKIAGFFGGLGAVVGNVASKIELFVEDIIKGNDAVGSAAEPFVKFIVLAEAIVLSLVNFVKVVATLIRDIPILINALVNGFEKIGVASGKAFSPTAGILGLFKSLFSTLIPGMGQLTDKTSDFHQALKILNNDLKPLVEFDPFVHLDKRAQEVLGVIGAAAKKARDLFRTGLGDVISPTDIAFKEGDDSKADTRRKISSEQAALVQAARAKRASSALLVSTDIDIDLQSARRDLALLEQGFVLVRGQVSDFRSELRETANFISDQFIPLTQGQAVSFGELRENVTRVNQETLQSVFSNLDRQYQIAVQGLETFRKTARLAAEEASEVEVTPVTVAATEIRNEATEEYVKLATAAFQYVLEADQAVRDSLTARDNLNKITETGLQKQEVLGLKILKQANADAQVQAQARLTESEQFKISSDRFAAEQEASKLVKADILDRTAAAIQARINHKEDAQVAVETRKLNQERLRVVQQINIETGKLFQQNVAIAETIASINKSIGEAKPRTPFQAALAGINDIETSLTSQFAKTSAKALAVIARLEKQIAKAEADAAVNTPTDLAGIDRDKEALNNAANEQRLTGVLKEKAEASLEARRQIEALNLSLNAIGPAVESAANGLLTALTDSLEGKKTDFVRLFKGITDNLFKDAMKNSVDSLVVAAKDAFSEGFKKLAPNISSSMSGVLGPAFVAGFALIASFVLGQLLSGDNSSGSPGNPSVGIQSSEQVRGLIGGATQIPIGLVGESLQSALVPTNLLLSRIAAGVDRLSFGGIDPSVIESTISASISDALQIQLSAT